MTYQSGIYQIANLADGKRYIGSAVSLRRRWRQHKCALIKGDRRANSRLLNAWRKYGHDSFEFRPILYCSPENLVTYEQAAIDALKPEYNLRKDAASNLGIKLSAETRRRISEVQRGVSKGPQSDGHRIANALARTGIKLSASHRRRLSEAKLGIAFSVAHKRNMSRLSDDQARDIRRRIAAGEVQAHLAGEFGLSIASISNLKHRKTYAWVD